MAKAIGLEPEILGDPKEDLQSIRFAFKTAISNDRNIGDSVQPATALHGIIVVLRNIRFDVQQRGIVENVNLAKVEGAALDAE